VSTGEVIESHFDFKTVPVGARNEIPHFAPDDPDTAEERKKCNEPVRESLAGDNGNEHVTLAFDDRPDHGGHHFVGEAADIGVDKKDNLRRSSPHPRFHCPSFAGVFSESDHGRAGRFGQLARTVF
jgi:hypothetical protein